MAYDTPHQISILKPSAGILILGLAGEWRLGQALPSKEDKTNKIEAAGHSNKALFNTEGLNGT